MNYELAKKLKEAGFPNIRIGEYFEHRIGSHSDDYGGSSDALCYCNQDKIPTLSELIEACGDFWVLEKYRDGKWGATPRDTRLRDYGLRHDTPEEAVANLWLELNKKNA